MAFFKSKAFWGITATTAGAIYAVPKLTGNLFETPATRGVAEAFTAGGGSPTHTPAAGNATRSRTEVRQRREGEGVGASSRYTPIIFLDSWLKDMETGLGSKHFHENHAAQRADAPNVIAKKFNEAFTGMAAPGKSCSPWYSC
ncbi:hypothetical protein IWZ00DRAFT_146865 [Phyllosticta capitalensis]